MQKLTLPEPQPTPEEWRRLFAAAKTFKAAAPWKWMHEEDIFGVRDPESGELGFCSITGALGTHLALIVYQGERGLGSCCTALATMQTATDDLQDQEAGYLLMETPQLQVSFEDRNTLSSLERQVIKDLGLHFRGHQAWPWFRVFMPGRVPWFITAPQARFLTVMLEQALIMAQALQEPDALPLDWMETLPLPEELDLQIRTQEDGVWLLRRETVNPRYLQVQLENNAEALAAWRRKLPLQNMRMQVHLSPMPSGVEEGDLPPYLPYSLLAVEEENGMILGHALLLARPNLPEMLAEVPDRLLEIFQQLEFRPREVQVASSRLYDLLALPLGQLGIALTFHTELPALEDALSMLNQMMGENF